MPIETAPPPADYLPLVGVERARLLELLATLDEDAWSNPTPCPAWDVAGLCRHLLGDDLYVISRMRDGHLGTPPPPGLGDAGFITWLDGLQAGWVDASGRISPPLVVDLLTWLGPQLVAAYERVDPGALEAHVTWASDRPVPMWLEMAREVSEYWIHRQQLLVALDRPADLRPDLLGPVLDALCWAWPYRLGAVAAAPGATVRIEVTGSIERRWHVVRVEQGWDLVAEPGSHTVAVGRFDAGTCWRLLTNNLDSHAPLDLTGEPHVVNVVRRTRAIIGSPDPDG